MTGVCQDLTISPVDGAQRCKLNDINIALNLVFVRNLDLQRKPTENCGSTDNVKF